MLRKSFLLLFVFFFAYSSCLPIFADEGMWTFDNPPIKQVKDKFGFEMNRAWLDHVRLAACRLNNGGSGSFVSADGLVLTNHHVASSAIAQLSTPQRDLMKNGFYARTRGEELRCPDLEINVLYAYEEVTDRVLRAGRNAGDDRSAEKMRKAEMADIEKESTERTGLKSTVVTMYEGGEYWLYQFKKYTDVRLVFAPEAQAAEFGGDYDNFSFPRFGLDFSFFRVYENDRPARIEHYLKWNSRGAKENELIFVVGNPGKTDRLRTVSQLEYQRDIENLVMLKGLRRRRKALEEFSEKSAENARRADDALHSINNSLKRLNGQQEGLESDKLMRQKVDEEKELRQKVAASPELQRKFGDAWDQMADAYKKLYPTMGKRVMLSSFSNAPLAAKALQIVQYVTEVQKPNAERLEAYRESNLESLRFQLLSPAPVYADLEEVLLLTRLQELRDELGENDPFVQAVLGNKRPREAASDMIQGTRLADVNFRKSILDGGLAALERSNDPLLQAARRVDPIVRELDQWNKQNIDSVRNAAGEKVARARFAVYGRTLAPDANFNMRLSYGVVKGYEFNTTMLPYKTTFGGLFDREASFDAKPPFNIATRIKASRSRINMDTPVDFVYTADTIGGNSGSPVVNQAGELVGVNFDSNVHRFVSRYIYTEDKGRAMAVHAGGMMETIRNVYDAKGLAEELERGSSGSGGGGGSVPAPTPGPGMALSPDQVSVDLMNLANRIRGKVEAAERNNPDEPPFMNGNPEYLRFRFDNDRLESYVTYRERQLVIYPIDAYRAVFKGKERAEFDKQMNALKQLLIRQPVSPVEEITVFPPAEAAQVFHAQVKYLSFDGGKGVRFVSRYAQDVTPTTNDSIFYTFQGLSADGKYYIALFYPIDARGLPETDIVKRTVRFLERLQPADYDPDLTRLDDMVKSLKIGK